MESGEQENNGNHGADPFDEDSLSSCLPEIYDIFEEPVLFPHVGEQYQVEIPPVGETKSYDDDEMPAINKFGIGLPIPVTWVQYVVDDTKIKCEKEEVSALNIVPGMEGSAHLHNDSKFQVDYKFNTRGSALENPKLAGQLHRFACKAEFLNTSQQDALVAYSANHVMGDNDQNDYCISLLQRREDGNFYPLPGLPTHSWSDAEEQSFLLSLYIFGKNLIQVKKFMETKRMIDVLSFYYGKFYRSDAYHRWSECRKIKSRRSIHGQRIFTGWRQQELLSRIVNSSHKELQDTLLEATKSFNEGRSTLENFVFKLKAAVGLQVLVEAIGIGKGTHDLTGVALDHARANTSIPLHPEIPVGRACSSLSSAEIIKFLTGHFRLSKARSNDLFWEAVWPRLLAKGWHSEQPRNHGSLGFKNSLVFLVPSVKKFSKKRLVKGTHFFDSVSDVLSKVASDPKLLELDADGTKGGCSVKEENGWAVDAKMYRNGSSNHQHHFYLHPRRPSCNLERMKFTVVDTSLAEREGSFKLMEVRSLPLGANSSVDPSVNSQESRSDSSSETEDSTDISDDKDDSNSGSVTQKRPEDNRASQSDLPKILKPFPNAASTNGYASGDKCLVRLNNDKTLEVRSRCQNGQRVRPGQSNDSASTIKRRKLAACSKGTDRRTCSVIKRIRRDQRQMNSKPDPIKAPDTLLCDASPFQKKTNLYHNSESKAENDIVGQTNIPEDNKLQSRTFFDLNNLPTDADVAESSSNELKAEGFSQSSAGKQSADSNDAPVDEQSSTGFRRHSTRNRPPTAKALEALASGLLGTKRSVRPFNSTGRPSRKARKAYEEPGPVIAANLVDVASSTLSMSVAETVSKDYDESASKPLGAP
ncbi:uncharacterized protein LOC110028000 [Phalaenopsis equestris]|uniref:uncharacterized protein LOC110028000 n=1 Tax=Phalaenopsis equestris TaxID=78828 RepID=UPI0009E23769|nr:uncharacterized protein LOC110028000 [Phalaenopsis equestris]XP_020585343.1 uncharacterized protein LOC110028000 [Phalaenopsis equestris]XP_020585345.1 uncharacterized protein LOC110028000 [Phalaenopsis equestris]XP_020585346.1 uncharacterized protein LOC110028000 [Phalaenopsis equestris]XP_020585347.1 uncharacterized protein LOC110028000 [Phalaenopsis equestris]